MPLKARPRQTNRAADSATETPSRTRRDFSRLQTNRQTPFPESDQGRDWTESRCPPRPSRGCSFADQLPHSSANLNHEWTRMNTNVVACAVHSALEPSAGD